MPKIECVDLFGGIGGFRHGLSLADKDFTFNYYADIDKFACAVYNYNFHETWKPTDIRTVQADDIPDHRVLCAGNPCFRSGTPVMTDVGCKSIENVAIGDRVLTHTGRFCKVADVKRNDYSGMMVTISTKYGYHPIESTYDHPILVRHCSRIWNNTRRHYDKVYGNPEFVPSNAVIPGDYVCVVRTPSINRVPTFEYTFGINQSRSEIRSLDLSNEDIWFIIGFYIANGWYLETRKRQYSTGMVTTNSQLVILACNYSQIDEIMRRLDRVGFSAHVSTVRTCNRVNVTNKGLHDYIMENIPKYAHNKRLPTGFELLPSNLLKSLIHGYMFGDGYLDKTHNVISSTTVSKGLAYDLQYAITLLNNYPVSFRHEHRTETCVIEGRVVNQRPAYSVKAHLNGNTKNYVIIDGLGIWVRVTDVAYECLHESIEVWNLEVEEDKSYTAWRFAVHNCVAFSRAGLERGFNDPRGQLFFEVERIIRAKQPEYILLENVAGLLSNDRGRTFARVLDTLRDCGYVGSWCCINSAAFLPQSRKRVYLVGRLGDEPCGALLPFADGNGESYPPCRAAQGEEERLWDYPANTLQSRDGKGGAMQYIVRPHPATHPCLTPNRPDKRQHGRRFREDGDPMFTLTTRDIHGVLLADDGEYIVRRLTPLEYDRLQGFPDNWTQFGTFPDGIKEISKSRRYQLAGNSVTIPVITAIGNELRKELR